MNGLPPSPTSSEPRRFEFIRCVGTGGFGEVYLARMSTHSGLSRDVAVKLLRSNLDASALARLRDEAALLAALNHRAILAVDDLLELGGRPALVTEFIDGTDLSGIIQASGALPPKVALEIVGDVASALAAALSTPSPTTGRPLGLVHRDIKPGNIRIGRSGAVKLLDFGIAISNELPRAAKTATGMVAGTPGYIAPERLEREGVHPPSDIYALGCTLYASIVGEPLCHQLSHAKILRVLFGAERHAAFLSERLPLVESAAGPAVAKLVARTLSHDPSRRPTAADLEQACEDLAAALPGDSVRRWARGYDWPEAAAPKGSSLEGRVLVAATLGDVRHPPASVAPPLSAASPPPVAPPAAPARGTAPASARWGLGTMLGLGALVVGGGTALLLVGGGVLVFLGRDAAPDASAPVTPPPEEAAADAPKAPPADATREPAPASAVSAPAATARTASSRTPSPPKTAPAAPVAEPAPAPSSSFATVSATGAQAVWLEADGVRSELGQVWPGRYQIRATFENGVTTGAGSVSVAEGETVVLRCDAGFMQCRR